MNPSLRRLIITVSVLGVACSIVLLTLLGRTAQPGQQQSGQQAVTPQAAPVGETDSLPEPVADQTPAQPTVEAATTAAIPGLHAVWVPVPATPMQDIGSLDPDQARMLLEFSPAGAGLERITLSDFWQTAAQSRQARDHQAAVRDNDPNPPPLPAAVDRYVLQTASSRLGYDAAKSQWIDISVPQLAAFAVVINGTEVNLLKQYTDDDGNRWVLWRETAAGAFEATIVDESKTPVARITRRFVLGNNYDIGLEQVVTNLTTDPMQVRWIQYGPGDLIVDRARYMDRRRFRFGYLPDTQLFPDLIDSSDGDLLFERSDILKRGKKAAKSTDPARIAELLTLWPNPDGVEHGYQLSWFAATNRYFALAVHPVLDISASGHVTGSRAIAPVITEVRTEVTGSAPDQHIFTSLYSATRTVAAGKDIRFDLGVYAGPLDRDVLAFEQPLAALNLKGLILYQMSSMCAICTFQWLAHFLLWFLHLMDMVTLDWGVSIILLVLVVRTLLHPLTKRAQINMQRFGKVMGDLKPEIEKLQKKYPDDARKLQQEQMKLMRERGANPLQLLGCLPMFLQMPIWVALYAALYFAFELRHQPAFWGVFQLFWDWPFLADLSAADHFFGELKEPVHFLMWNITGINILPILLGVVFYIQQKYMSPPPSASMTPEQAQQQKIMKIMMVVLFPVMLYSAPSGLTLYICTSSFIGIIESKYVRAHIKAMDLEPPKPKKKKKKPKDLQARAYAGALERAKKKRQPEKKFKKRK